MNAPLFAAPAYNASVRAGFRGTLAERRAAPPDAVPGGGPNPAAGSGTEGAFVAPRPRPGHRAAPSPRYPVHLLHRHPETLLQWPASARTLAAWQAYFEAGGRLAAVPPRERTPFCYHAAVKHSPRALKDVPAPWRSIPMCLDAVGRDGYALGSVPPRYLAAGSVFRGALCERAYAGPRPPRIRDVPRDLLTEARCIRSLRWAPLDLRNIPQARLTTDICLAAIHHCPPGVNPDVDAIPYRLRNAQVALALAAHSFSRWHEDTIPGPDWYLPGTFTQEVAQAWDAHAKRERAEAARSEALAQEGRAAGQGYEPPSPGPEAAMAAATEADAGLDAQAPAEASGWPLLRQALRREPHLLVAPALLAELGPHALPPGGVTEAMCLEAVARVGLSPAHIPEDILQRPSFRRAVRELPRLPYNEDAFMTSIPDLYSDTPLDPLTFEWIDRHLREDPSRATKLGWFLQVDWALAAYRHGGMDLDEVVRDTPTEQIIADFVAELSPLAVPMEGAARDGSSSSSSSSSSTASAARPS